MRKLASMKAQAIAEIEAEQEKAERYAEGYYEGFSDGYDRALKDINKLRGVAIEEMLRGFGYGLDKAES